MSIPLRGTLKRAAAGLMLVLALVYLMHSVSHATAGEVALPPTGQAVAMEFDPFVYAESQTGDGVAGCHFFCNHGCPIPPLPEIPGLPEPLPARSFPLRLVDSLHGAPAQPETAPPRILA